MLAEKVALQPLRLEDLENGVAMRSATPPTDGA